MTKLSVLLSCFNEESTGYLIRIGKIALKTASQQIEWIAVDGGSTDKTLEILKEFPIELITDNSSQSTRASRLNKGFEKALGQVVLFHHPRTILDSKCLMTLAEMELSEGAWGCFTHKFEFSGEESKLEVLILKATSAYSNYIRVDHKAIVYLDHCIFMAKNSLKIPGPFDPRLAIFEDTQLSKKLRMGGKPQRLPELAITSPLRYQANGYLKQFLTNQYLKIIYCLGGSNQMMNRFYERKTHFNNSYK